MKPVKVIGGGLAGCEAAWQISRRGFPVQLFEMRPGKCSPAHRTGDLGELVCSNSFKSSRPDRASGLLKEEMRLAGSLLLAAAGQAAIPGGSALCVDRTEFSRRVTDLIEGAPSIEVIRREVTAIEGNGPVVVATGPLTSDPLAEAIRSALGTDSLFFYDAIAPTIEADTIEWDQVFIQDRYQERGTGAYVNCPLDREQYETLVRDLRGAEQVHPREFEETPYFEACMPVEELARRGERTLAFGPLRPTGLTDPKTGRRPFAVVQLRPENRAGTLYSMVGFQTRLPFPDQERIFRTITGLGKAAFERLGTIHRNTYLNSPSLLDRCQRVRSRPDLFFAGQITGVEGYMESAASGIAAGIQAAVTLAGGTPLPLPVTTMTGALLDHISSADPQHFQPVNAQFGLLPPLPDPGLKKDRKREALAERALKDMRAWVEEVDAGFRVDPKPKIQDPK